MTSRESFVNYGDYLDWKQAVQTRGPVEASKGKNACKYALKCYKHHVKSKTPGICPSCLAVLQTCVNTGSHRFRWDLVAQKNLKRFLKITCHEKSMAIRQALLQSVVDWREQYRYDNELARGFDAACQYLMNKGFVLPAPSRVPAAEVQGFPTPGFAAAEDGTGPSTSYPTLPRRFSFTKPYSDAPLPLDHMPVYRGNTYSGAVSDGAVMARNAPYGLPPAAASMPLWGAPPYPYAPPPVAMPPPPDRERANPARVLDVAAKTYVELRNDYEEARDALIKVVNLPEETRRTAAMLIIEDARRLSERTAQQQDRVQEVFQQELAEALMARALKINDDLNDLSSAWKRMISSQGNPAELYSPGARDTEDARVQEVTDAVGDLLTGPHSAPSPSRRNQQSNGPFMKASQGPLETSHSLTTGASSPWSSSIVVSPDGVQQLAVVSTAGTASAQQPPLPPNPWATPSAAAASTSSALDELMSLHWQVPSMAAVPLAPSMSHMPTVVQRPATNGWHSTPFDGSDSIGPTPLVFPSAIYEHPRRTPPVTTAAVPPPSMSTPLMPPWFTASATVSQPQPRGPGLQVPPLAFSSSTFTGSVGGATFSASLELTPRTHSGPSNATPAMSNADILSMLSSNPAPPTTSVIAPARVPPPAPFLAPASTAPPPAFSSSTFSTSQFATAPMIPFPSQSLSTFPAASSPPPAHQTSAFSSVPGANGPASSLLNNRAQLQSMSASSLATPSVASGTTMTPLALLKSRLQQGQAEEEKLRAQIKVATAEKNRTTGALAGMSQAGSAPMYQRDAELARELAQLKEALAKKNAENRILAAECAAAALNAGTLA